MDGGGSDFGLLPSGSSKEAAVTGGHRRRRIPNAFAHIFELNLGLVKNTTCHWHELGAGQNPFIHNSDTGRKTRTFRGGSMKSPILLFIL